MEREEVFAFEWVFCFFFLMGCFRQDVQEIAFQNEIFDQRLENAYEKAITKLEENILVRVNSMFKNLGVEISIVYSKN